MGKVRLEGLSTEQLTAKLRTARAIQRTTTGIFAVIILAWIVLGLWRANLPVFISTVAVSLALTVSQAASRRGLEMELQRRQGSAA